MTSGWAVHRKHQGIFVNTVSSTRRAAIVNWLVTERNELVRASTTDDQIETMWHGLKTADESCLEVKIELDLPPA